MAKDMNLKFIKEKVQQLRTAVMYSMSNSIDRLPNDIVTAIRIDEEGQLWFLCRGPHEAIKEYEQSFPARLSFFRKGFDFFVEVSGKATVVNENYTNEKEGVQRTLLVKLNMLNVEYTEPHTRKPKNKVEVLLENGYKWFLRTAAIPHNNESILAKLHHTNYN